MSKTIKLGGKYGSKIGNYAIVDDNDFEWLNQYKWSGVKDGNNYYAQTNINHKSIKMHRLILNLTDPKQIVDHINQNGLDNCKTNLRICTTAQNRWNSRKRKSQYPYLGVQPSSYFFRAIINFGGKKINIGVYDTIEKAAIAYDKKALELHGQFATLNFPDNDYNKIDYPEICYIRKANKYKYISWREKRNRYYVRIKLGGATYSKEAKTLEEAFNIIQEFKDNYAKKQDNNFEAKEV